MNYRKYPTVYGLESLMHQVNTSTVSVGLAEGRWVPARPEGFCSFRSALKAAWLVYTGRADAVIWPQDAPSGDGAAS